MNGIEWIVEAHGCSPSALADLSVLRGLFERIIADLKLRPVGKTQWHQFPRTGGLTGLCLLAESHLTCHTFPEFGSLCLNLFCCVPRSEWDFTNHLSGILGASSVTVRRVVRPYSEVSATGEDRLPRPMVQPPTGRVAG